MPGAPQVDDSHIKDSAGLCASGLDGLSRGFLKSFHGREDDFLRLGRSLDEFNSLAQGVSGRASDLAEMTSGDAIGDAAQRLASHLERLGQACGQAEGAVDLATLDGVAQLGAKLTESMRDFGRLVKHLTMLGIATRIESARLGNQGMGFSTLADDVEKLAGKIVSSSDKILGRALSLVGQCHEASKSISEMNAMRSSCSANAMTMLRGDLDALRGLMDSSRQIAVGISGDAESIVRSVSEAVLSMQFHDIIRQQLEHVAEATDEARNMALEGPMTEGGHNASDWEELSGWMLSVLTLQRSQLGNARMRFAEAMQSLSSSLEDIAGRVENIAARAGSLAEQEGGQGGVLKQIEVEVAHIAQSLREYSALEQRMSAVLGEVAASIEDMSASVAEIEEVGSEIELIALNASVKAAHTGEEGKALGVLASAIQKLSVDARGQTEGIMALLGAVDPGALIGKGASSVSENIAYLDSVITDLDLAVSELKSLESRSAEAAALVQRMAGELSGDIARAVESLEFQYGLIDDMTSAESRLDDLTEILRQALPAGMEPSHSPRLKEMLERYTMDAERLVHESVLGISSGDSAVTDDGDYGGNVELF